MERYEVSQGVGILAAGTRTPDTRKLLNLDGCTRVGEFLLNCLSLFFRNGFLHRLRSSFHEVFGFLQTESRNLANDLDDVDLIAAYCLQDHVKLSLLFRRSRCLACHGRRRRYSRFSSRYPESCLQLFPEL